MDYLTFIQRLEFVIKVRPTFTRTQLVELLNTFWNFNKTKLGNIDLIPAHHQLKVILNTFDIIIEESNRRYSWVKSTVLLKVVVK